MKVSNQVFTTSNSNKCVGGLYLCMYVFISVQGISRLCSRLLVGFICVFNVNGVSCARA